MITAGSNFRDTVSEILFLLTDKIKRRIGSLVSGYCMGLLSRAMSAASTPIKVSFSFYPADVRALNDRKAGLMKAGLPVRGGTVLRALIHLTPPADMFAHAVLVARAYEQKKGPREKECIADHPTVDLPRELVQK